MIKKIIVTTILISCFITTYAHADWQLGIKGGLIDYDTPGSDPGINGSLILAHRLWDWDQAGIDFESELTTSLIDGEINTGDTDFQSLGAYTTLRTNGSIYFIAKLGLAHAKVNSLSDTNLSSGFGIGLNSGIRWEVQYTSHSVENIDIKYLSFGVGF